MRYYMFEVDALASTSRMIGFLFNSHGIIIWLDSYSPASIILSYHMMHLIDHNKLNDNCHLLQATRHKARQKMDRRRKHDLYQWWLGKEYINAQISCSLKFRFIIFCVRTRERSHIIILSHGTSTTVCNIQFFMQIKASSTTHSN